MTIWEILALTFAITGAMWIVRIGFFWIIQLFRDTYEILAGKRRWDDD